MVGQTPGTWSPRRVISVLAAVGSLLALALLSGCGDEEGAATQVESGAPITTSATSTGPRDGTDERADGSEKPAKAEADDETPKAGSAGNGERGEKSDQGSEGKAPARSGCPGDLSAEDCAALADAIESDTTDDTTDDVCPTGLSTSDCRALAEQIKADAAGGSEDDPDGGCPAALTRQQCKRVAAALGG